MAVNDLIVRILGDTKGLQASFAKAKQASADFGVQVDKTSGKIDKANKSNRRFAVGAAAGIAGTLAASEALRQLGAAVDVASNLSEQISKTNVVFGSSADEIKKWAETTAESIGIANDEALAAASTFGSMFDQAGADSQKAANLSKAVTQLAADLASFNNTSVEDSLTALRSGLSGEIEPLRRFQVFLTEAAVAQRAMADTGKDNVKQLTQGEKILARYALIMEQTAKQQGDFERTSGGLANQQRKLAAQTRDLQATLGNLLLPVILELTENLNTAAQGALALADGLRALGNVKIPEIEIPFLVTIGGQSVGDLAGDAFSVAKFTPLNPLFGLTIAKAIADQFKDQAEEATPDLSKSIQTSMETMVSDSLKAAGTFGITQLPQGGDDLALKFGSGIAAAIDAAQALAAKKIKQGKARIAAQKAAEEAAKQREAAEKAAEKELARKRAARAREQARQFRALGLAATGDEIVPGITDLQKRINGALRRIDSGEIDVSSKLVDRLKLARNLIKKEGGNLTAETRTVINDLVKTVTQGTKKLEDKGGPLTKSVGLNVQKVLEGMGLSPEIERELRARLAGVNSTGRQLTRNNRPTGSFRAPGQVNETTVNVNLDGEQVGKSVTRTQQKNVRRNPKQKRGPRSGV